MDKIIGFLGSKNGAILIGSIIVILILYVAFGDQLSAWLKGKGSDAANDENEVMKLGSSGANVVTLQGLLVSEKTDALGGSKIDGIFGSITEAALMAARGVKTISLKDFKAGKKTSKLNSSDVIASLAYQN